VGAKVADEVIGAGERQGLRSDMLLEAAQKRSPALDVDAGGLTTKA
jgi:hypothetical protein